MKEYGSASRGYLSKSKSYPKLSLSLRFCSFFLVSTISKRFHTDFQCYSSSATTDMYTIYWRIYLAASSLSQTSSKLKLTNPNKLYKRARTGKQISQSTTCLDIAWVYSREFLSSHIGPFQWREIWDHCHYSYWISIRINQHLNILQ